MNKAKSLKYGFSIVEVLVATSIISVCFIFIFSGASQAVSLSANANRDYQASLVLDETIEVVKLLRIGGWANISTGLPVCTVYGADGACTYGISWSGSTWQFVGAPTNINGFTRSISIYSVYRDSNSDIAETGTVDNDTKKIVVNVSWSFGGQTKTKSITFYVTNIF